MNKLVSGEDNIGTTLRGIGPCYADKVGRSFAIRLGDLIQPSFPDRVRKIVEVKRKVLSAVSGGAADLPDAESIIEQFSAYAERLRPMIADTNHILQNAVEQDKQILFEGAQGSLLDIDHGTFPFVTSSNASGTGISTGSGVPGNWIGNIIGVCKTYATRVGGGPFPTEQENETGQHIREMGNEFGTTTGRPRRCGWFDAVAVRYTARLSGVSSIALTMVDVLSELKEIEVCVGYKLDGKDIDYFPGNIDELRRVEPVYKAFPGWQQDVTAARTLDDLPTAAVSYAHEIEKLIGRPIEFLSVGPDRAQTIHVPDGVSLKDYLSKRPA